MKGSPLDLGKKNINQLLKEYSIPAIIAMVASSLYNITDSIFIGHGVGPLALSALAISFPLMNLAAAFGALIGVGAASLLSLRLGQKDYKVAESILGNVFIMNSVIGISFSLITLPFLKEILIFFGATEKTLPYAYEFMYIILLGNVITHMYLGLNAMLRASGSPKRSMFATIYTVLINLVLNPLFLFVFDWGIRGSALATVSSQTMVLIWQIYLFSNKKDFIYIKKGIFKFNFQIVKDTISIGLAPFLMNSASCVIVILINQDLLKYGGDLAIGAYGIVNRITFLFVMIVLGLNQGMQPIAGYNYGSGNYIRVKEVFKKTFLCAVIVMTSGFLIAEIAPHLLASIFTTDDNLINLGTTGLRIVFIFYPIVSIQMVASTLFQSINQPKKAIILSLTRQVIFLIPALLILPKYMGINGVWASMPMADFISIVIATIMVQKQFKIFDNKIKLQILQKT